MQVKEIGRESWVVRDDGTILAGPFSTNAAAWAWVDRHDGGDDGTDACNRIRQAFNGSYRPDRY